MNAELLKQARQKVAELSSNTKSAFVPGPSVQSQVQRLKELAASEGTDQQAQQMASEQAKAQGQGAPPMMRIEDLAQIVQQGFEMMTQGIQQVMQMIQQPPQQPQQAAPADAGAGGAGGAGGEKKPKKDDLILQQLQQMNQTLSALAGGQPAGGAPPPAAAQQGAPPQ